MFQGHLAQRGPRGRQHRPELGGGLGVLQDRRRRAQRGPGRDPLRDGPAVPRPGRQSVYEYGGRAGVWRLQRLFDEFKIPVTFFGAAVAFERNPEVAAYLREAGHEPCCHGWRWEEVWTLSRDEEREHMLEAIRSIEETCGVRPHGWYCRYGPSVNARELLRGGG